jgi:hypothetical protein
LLLLLLVGLLAHQGLRLHVLDLLRIHLVWLALLVVPPLPLRTRLMLHRCLLCHHYLLLMLEVLARVHLGGRSRKTSVIFDRVPYLVLSLGLSLSLLLLQSMLRLLLLLLKMLREINRPSHRSSHRIKLRHLIHAIWHAHRKLSTVLLGQHSLTGSLLLPLLLNHLLLLHLLL